MKNGVLQHHFQKIIREYFEKLCSNKSENLKKWMNFCDLSKLNQENIKSLNLSTMNNEIELVTKNFLIKKSLKLGRTIVNSTRTLKKKKSFSNYYIK
jgi:hypothetical protein